MPEADNVLYSPIYFVKYNSCARNYNCRSNRNEEILRPHKIQRSGTTIYRRMRAHGRELRNHKKQILRWQDRRANRQASAPPPHPAPQDFAFTGFRRAR